jgi:hypothetical protein
MEVSDSAVAQVNYLARVHHLLVSWFRGWEYDLGFVGIIEGIHL